MKIVSRSAVGWEDVYDIGLAGDHNFLLANGVIAANCFNKSHATAYGYVTYQTAYLKANFPVEYMAALLTANSDDQDNVKSYIEDCFNMGIDINIPDVNRSEIDFTITTEGNVPQILFGLSAVRNVGPKMTEIILQARARGGAFQNLADFCERILEFLDGRILNRRALESLIDCGAMNSLHPQGNRNQLKHDLPLVLEWAQARAKDRAVGQVNLFDLQSAPSAPPVADLTESEKLRKEKELLGFYLSNNLLKEIHRVASKIVPISLADMGDKEKPRSQGIVSMIAMLTEIKPITTKHGERMVIVKLEDIMTEAEGVVFPKAYRCIHEQLKLYKPMLLWGTLEKRDKQTLKGNGEETRLVIEDAELLELAKVVQVNFPVEQEKDIQIKSLLSQVLKRQKQAGVIPKVPVIIKVTDVHGNGVRYIPLGMQFWVCDAHYARESLIKARFDAEVIDLLRIIRVLGKLRKQSVFISN